MRRWTSAWIAAGLLVGITGAAIGAGTTPDNAATAPSGEIGPADPSSAASLDPYVAVRDAYVQHRAGMVRKK
jgi:hypothetical protein